MYGFLRRWKRRVSRISRGKGKEGLSGDVRKANKMRYVGETSSNKSETGVDSKENETDLS